MILMWIRSHLKYYVLFWATTMNSFLQQIFMECLLCAKHISSLPRAWKLNNVGLNPSFVLYYVVGQHRLVFAAETNNPKIGHTAPQFCFHFVLHVHHGLAATLLHMVFILSRAQAASTCNIAGFRAERESIMNHALILKLLPGVTHVISAQILLAEASHMNTSGLTQTGANKGDQYYTLLYYVSWPIQAPVVVFLFIK